MRLLAALFILFFTASCGSKRSEISDISSVNNIIKIAERLSIERKDGYSVVRIINPWQGAETVEFKFILLQPGYNIPGGYEKYPVIHVPVNKMICMSATHLAMVDALGEDSTISGISGKNYVFNTRIKNLIDDDLIKDVGYEAALNNELILKLNPEVIMPYGIGSESSGYLGKIMETGIQILYNADYLEEDPLGKAEWIKLFGALYCKEKLADSIFDSEVIKYDSIKAFIDKNRLKKPIVLLGLPYKDTWYISPGNSYISRLISDAGGKYLWEDVISSESMPTGIENVYIRAMNADFWLNAGTSESIADIILLDERLGTLPCIKNAYNNNLRLNITGGNDYWEIGTLHPHLVLLDIASILHPDLFPDHKLRFYRKL
ncbi:MAG TPA: ABC transporter substrate-binding protein [Bacteroidales bacterium]|nr:ABC transporter substrate-binding protein [Bacteroidales bacterium]